MARDVLEFYQETCDRAFVWLSGSMTKQDLAPLFALARKVAHSVPFAAPLRSRLKFTGKVVRRVGREADQLRRSFALTAGSYAFKVAAWILRTTATARAKLLMSVHVQSD